MALASTIDGARVGTQLVDWLRTRFPGASDLVVENIEIPKSSGMSTETVMFDVVWTDAEGSHNRQLIARIEPGGKGLFPEYRLDYEARVISALAEHTEVPVPRVFGYEGDPAVLGAPFFVMSRVRGRVAPDDPPFPAGSWVTELSTERQAQMCDSGLRALARIHAVDHGALGFHFLDRPELGGDALDQMLNHLERFHAWAGEGRSHATVDPGLAWLRKNRPAEIGPKVLSWGDARIGNMIIDDQQEVAAVLDWEMLSLGTREMDLGWWIFLDRHHSEGIGAPLPPGFLAKPELIARYEQLTGYSVRDIDYYEVFAAVRMAILVERAGWLMIESGLLPPDAQMAEVNPATTLLADLLGLDGPTGESAYYIGNR